MDGSTSWKRMEAAIAAPREEISQYAPRISPSQIPGRKIREVIGPGGKVIRGLVEKDRAGRSTRRHRPHQHRLGKP